MAVVKTKCPCCYVKRNDPNKHHGNRNSRNTWYDGGVADRGIVEVAMVKIKTKKGNDNDRNRKRETINPLNGIDLTSIEHVVELPDVVGSKNRKERGETELDTITGSRNEKIVAKNKLNRQENALRKIKDNRLKRLSKLANDRKNIRKNKSLNTESTTSQVGGRGKLESTTWFSLVDESSGKTYYCNKDTNEVQWEQPEEFHTRLRRPRIILLAPTQIPNSPDIIFVFS